MNKLIPSAGKIQARPDDYGSKGIVVRVAVPLFGIPVLNSALLPSNHTLAFYTLNRFQLPLLKPVLTTHSQKLSSFLDTSFKQDGFLFEEGFIHLFLLLYY